MKIAEIEARLQHGEYSEELLALFKDALKRVPKAGRCQHCYTTAAGMPMRFSRQAVGLIQYGLQEHCAGWVDRMRSFHNIAVILEKQGDYSGAKQAYSEALSSVEAGNRSVYTSEYAAHLMRTEMHINNFEYTQELENYYDTALQADEFRKVFQTATFYRLLAQIIISRHRGDLPAARVAYDEANKMLRPGFSGPLTLLLKKKGVSESTGTTKEARNFLRRVSKLF